MPTPALTRHLTLQVSTKGLTRQGRGSEDLLLPEPRGLSLCHTDRSSKDDV